MEVDVGFTDDWSATAGRSVSCVGWRPTWCMSWSLLGEWLWIWLDLNEWMNCFVDFRMERDLDLEFAIVYSTPLSGTSVHWNGFLKALRTVTASRTAARTRQLHCGIVCSCCWMKQGKGLGRSEFGTDSLSHALVSPTSSIPTNRLQLLLSLLSSLSSPAFTQRQHNHRLTISFTYRRTARQLTTIYRSESSKPRYLPTFSSPLAILYCRYDVVLSSWNLPNRL